MNDLDIKDKKIIALLYHNSRAKLHELAKETNLSKNSVKYRIDRLKSQGYISSFIPIINYASINYSTYDLFLKLKMKKEQEHILIAHFKQHPNILWASTTFGEWDFFIQFIDQDFFDFYNVHLAKLLEQYHEYIDDYEVKIAVKRLKIEHTIPEFSEIIKEKKISKKPISTQKVDLDQIDLRLLHALNKNAHASFLELGQEINESLETTRNHFNRLIKNNVLLGFSLDLNYNKLGYIDYLVFFKFHYFSSIKEHQFQNYIQTKKEIKLAVKNGNFPEIYLMITTKNPFQLESIVKEIKDNFSVQIQKITTLTITSDIKFDMFPSGLIRK